MQNKAEKTRSSPRIRPFLNVLDYILLLARRQRYHAGMIILALLGIILAVGLVTNASFFSEGVDRVILLQNLAEFSRVTDRPPFSTSVYIFPSRRFPITLQNAEDLSGHVGEILASQVGLPLRHLGLEISSGKMILQPQVGSDLYQQGVDYLGSLKGVYIQGIAEHMLIDQGVPLDEDGASGAVLEVWMHNRMAQEMGAHLDEEFIIRPDGTVEPTPIRLVGFWHAADPDDDFWFGDPDSELKDALIVRRADYLDIVQPMVASGSREVSWYVILDENKMVPKESAAYLAGFQRAQYLVDQFLPGVRFNTPPLDPLEDFVQRSTSLNVILLGYYLPAFAILLYFLLLVSAIIAQWQRQEISIFISRGMSLFSILNLTLLEQILLFILGLPLGVAFGLWIARVMGYTASFLAFTSRPPLPVSLHGLSLPLTLVAFGVSLVSRVWPILQVNRQNILAQGHEWARPSQAPFWYRYYLDFLLLLPTYYAYTQMVQRGSLVGMIVSQPEDLYQDPLLIVVPALFVVTGALVTMRLFSVVMRLLDLVANRTPWLPIHLALRQLGRQSHEYISPLLLVIIALAMGIYTISMAASLDQWLVDRIYYRAGADMTFEPRPNVDGLTYPDGNWVPAPYEFTQTPGVLAATRVGSYFSQAGISGAGEVRGQFLAVDRLDFPRVAWWRPDLAQESLGSLMNRLALTPEGILVSQDFIDDFGLRVGDQVQLQVDVTDYSPLHFQATIAGVFNYFPTIYEGPGYGFVGNLDQLVTVSGFIPIHEIWLKIDPGADETEIRKALPAAVQVVPSPGMDAGPLVRQEESKMERVGIFGTLTIGFLASAAMAILGLLIYSNASLRQRMYRFSVLHAVGLLHRQIVLQVVLEYTFLAAFGALSGTVIGILTARLFIPFFRFTSAIGVPLPPLIPLMADRPMAWLAVSFSLIIVVAEVLTIASALRRRLERIR